MGSTFISMDDAQERLGCCRKTLLRYIQKGYLRPSLEGMRRGILEEDLIQFMKRGESATPLPFNKITISQLFARVAILEGQISVLQKLLNIRYESLNLTDPQIQNLYQMAKHHLINNWEPHSEDTWADALIRISTEDFNQLERVVQDKQPWKPFYMLALAMARDAYNKDLRDQFTAAVNHLQGLASIHCQLKGDPLKDISVMVKNDGSVHRILRMRDKVRRRGPERLWR